MPRCAKALARTDSGFRLGLSLPHRYRSGGTDVYDAVARPRPDIAAVRDMGLPSKAMALTKLQ